MEATWMSIDKWMDKKDVVYKYTEEYNLDIKKNEIIAATWMNLDYLTKWNKSGKKTTDTIYHLYLESKMWHKWTYLQNSNTVTKNKFVVIIWKGGGGRDKLGVWD